jgi:hypothetical protein
MHHRGLSKGAKNKRSESTYAEIQRARHPEPSVCVRGSDCREELFTGMFQNSNRLFPAAHVGASQRRRAASSRAHRRGTASRSATECDRACSSHRVASRLCRRRDRRRRRTRTRRRRRRAKGCAHSAPRVRVRRLTVVVVIVVIFVSGSRCPDRARRGRDAASPLDRLGAPPRRRSFRSCRTLGCRRRNFRRLDGAAAQELADRARCGARTGRRAAAQGLDARACAAVCARSRGGGCRGCCRGRTSRCRRCDARSDVAAEAATAAFAAR